jgi:iron only hydrogenase large subunit-like protein
MACPGGCIAGAGTLADPARSAMMLNKYKAQATMKTAADTPYKDTLDKLKY